MIINFTDSDGKFHKVEKDYIQLSWNYTEASKSFFHCRGEYICSILAMKNIVNSESIVSSKNKF